MTTLAHLRVHVARVVAETPDDAIPAAVRLLVQAQADLEARHREALTRRADPVIDGETLYTIRDAAKLAAVSPSYIKAQVRAGKLPAVRLPGTTVGSDVQRVRPGKAVRIRRRDLLAFVAPAERKVA